MPGASSSSASTGSSFGGAAFPTASFRTIIRDPRHVLRGLQDRYAPRQGKLVGVMRGRIWDVAVDLRARSKTFGQHYGRELSDLNGLLMWIPPGFAHGFSCSAMSPRT